MEKVTGEKPFVGKIAIIGFGNTNPVTAAALLARSV
jgi:hypothetical protein